MGYGLKRWFYWFTLVLVAACVVVADLELLSDADMQESHLVCSGSKSRAARESLEELLYPAVRREGYELPAKCPLAQSNDVMLPLEAHKYSRSGERWKCLLCKRSFAGEQYLDLHFKKKHPEIWSETSVCLADYCDILQCHEYEDNPSLSQALAGCTPASLEKRMFECKDIIQKCFPLEAGGAASRLNAQFTRSLCDALSCSPTEPRRKRWSKLGNTIWLVLVSTIGVGLILFYTIFWLMRRNQQLGSELRRLSSERHTSRLRLWGKMKNY